MKAWITAGLLATIGGAAASETPRDYFDEAVRICMNFGNVAGMAQMRLEDDGWTVDEVWEWGDPTLTSPDGRHHVSVSLPDSDYPLFCSVESDFKTVVDANNSAYAAVIATGYAESSELKDGCPYYTTSLGQRVWVFSRGNGGVCDDPSSAAVLTQARVNPIGKQ